MLAYNSVYDSEDSGAFVARDLSRASTSYVTSRHVSREHHTRTNEPTRNPFTAALHAHAAGASPEAGTGLRRMEESCAMYCIGMSDIGSHYLLTLPRQCTGIKKRSRIRKLITAQFLPNEPCREMRKVR